MPGESNAHTDTLDISEELQEFMIRKVVDYFLYKGENPRFANEALKSLCVMEAFLQIKKLQ